MPHPQSQPWTEHGTDLRDGCRQHLRHTGIGGPHGQLHDHAWRVQRQFGSNKRIVATPIDPGQVERVLLQGKWLLKGTEQQV